MMDPEEDPDVTWYPISQDFLFDHFGNDELRLAVDYDKFDVEPSKIHFSDTPYDRYYYKNKFPKLEDHVCELLEKCSIDKMKKLPQPQPDQTPAKQKKHEIAFKHGNFIVDFN